MENLNLIYYSPTGTTQKIIREIGKNMGFKQISENNIAEDSSELIPKTTNNSLTIIGMPVYAGRIPITAIESLKSMKSNQSPVVLLVVYGNRDYDDSLLELKEIATNCGFNVIAGAAFIGEHSFSSKEKPVAENRPDKQDLEKCNDFANMINKKLKTKNKIAALNIPGNYPYKERKKLPTNIHPVTDNTLCSLCGICIDVCPTNAISIEKTVITDGNLCTLCGACVKNCDSEARIFDNPTINGINERLFINCSTRKEPIYFI